MSSEIDLIYREWQEAIRDRFNIKGEQVVVAKPSNPAHLSILKEMCLKAGFTSDQANSILLILEKDKKAPPLDKAGKDEVERLGLVWKGKGYGKENEEGITHKNVDGKLVKVGDKDDTPQIKKGVNTNYAEPGEEPEVGQSTVDGSHHTNKKPKKLNKTQQTAQKVRDALDIPEANISDPQRKKDLDSMLNQVDKRMDRLNDKEKEEVRNTVNAIQTLYDDNATDEEKAEAWRNINVSCSPNRRKLYLESLRGMGEHKILSKGGSDPVARLVKEVSKYKDLPEDDNKVYLKLEALAKPDIGGGELPRSANKRKGKKYTDEPDDPNVQKLMDTEPLNRITKPAYKTLFGPVGPDGYLLIPSSDNSRAYFEHSVNNNTSLEKTAEFLEELENENPPKADPRLSKSLRAHQKRLQDIAKNYEIPSEEARKAVEESYALLAEELHQASPEMANRMLKQFAEMEQYDSEIAGGDECYLPGHGSFPGGDKLLFEKGNAGAKRVAFVSIKYGKGGTKKRVVYGFPANMSALQQLHPDESKRDSLGSYTGQPGYSIGVKDELVETSEKATENITTLLDEIELGDLFTDDEKRELGDLTHRAKTRVDELIKEATGSDGKVDWSKFAKLRENDPTMVRIDEKLRKICPQDKLAQLIGSKNAEPYGKRLTPEIFMGSVIAVNQIKTSNGYDFLKHNKQYIEDGEIKNDTIDGSMDMNDWYFHMRFKRTDGRNGGGVQSSCVGSDSHDDIEALDSNSDNIV